MKTEIFTNSEFIKLQQEILRGDFRQYNKWEYSDNPRVWWYDNISGFEFKSKEQFIGQKRIKILKDLGI